MPPHPADPADPADPAVRHAVRRALLAVVVLDEVDLRPLDAGVLLPAGPRGPEVLLDWAAAAAVLDGAAADPPAARPRLRSWLRLHRAVADLGPDAARVLGRSARALALHSGGALHPGAGWVREQVLGGALDVGLGVVDLVPTEPCATPLWPDVARATGLDEPLAWAAAREHLEAMGALAAQRLARDRRASWTLTGATVLRPVGGCDVPTLLASSALRTWLAQEDGSGMRTVAVPARARGWFDLTRVDPAFVGAAWSATDVDQRGLPRAVLVTADEVVQARGV